MENNTNPTYSGVCRLCLEKPVAVDIFEKPDLAQDILLCTGVDVTKSSKLPRKICLKCFDIVLKAKELRNLATANDLQMKVLFDYEDNLINENDKSNDGDSGSSSDDDRLYIDDTGGGNGFEDSEMTTISMSSTIHEEIKTESLSVCDNVPGSIVVRRDLFEFSEPKVSPSKESTEDTKYSLTRNFKINKSDVDATYTCEFCQKEFTAWKKLYLHQRTHNKNLPCPLKTCGKKFATKGDVEKHLRTHTGERPYKCDICDKRFSQQCTLRIHKETVHAKETLVIY